MALEQFDHLREVGETSSKAVDLVDHYDIDAACLDIDQQALERGTVHVAAGIGRVVVVVGHRDPPLGPLAGDIGMTGIALGVDGIVFLVQPVVRGDAGVDSATKAAWHRLAHRSPPSLPRLPGLRRPKKSGPDHWAPVISRAMRDRLR